MSKDLYYMQEALKLIKHSNSIYSPILDNVDTLLGPDVLLEFATANNGNLLSKKDSPEIRALVASALTANWRSSRGESKGKDDFLASDISISPHKYKLDK